MRAFLLGLSVAWAAALGAAEMVFDFSQDPENQAPPSFRGAVTGAGRPGDWKIIMDEVPSAFPPLSPQAPQVSHQAVLAQLARDPADEHFPLLIYEDEIFDDFTFSTRFKTVGGQVERMAGIAFRIQDETNYYVLRASSLGNTLRFYKVVDGVRGAVIGPDLKIPSGQWHELGVTCRGNEIRCSFNGREAMPALQDNTFSRGKVGFWTKSDSVSYFTGAKVVYRPLEMPARKLVRNTRAKFNRLLGLAIYVAAKDGSEARLIAADPEATGRAGGPNELDVIRRGVIYYGKGKDSVTVTQPLRDKNGDPIAAVRVRLTTFPGITEQTALARALPIVKTLQANVQNLDDLTGELPVQ